MTHNRAEPSTGHELLVGLQVVMGFSMSSLKLIVFVEGEVRFTFLVVSCEQLFLRTAVPGECFLTGSAISCLQLCSLREVLKAGHCCSTQNLSEDYTQACMCLLCFVIF